MSVAQMVYDELHNEVTQKLWWWSYSKRLRKRGVGLIMDQIILRKVELVIWSLVACNDEFRTEIEEPYLKPQSPLLVPELVAPSCLWRTSWRAITAGPVKH